jgi:hypothetical protein
MSSHSTEAAIFSSAHPGETAGADRAFAGPASQPALCGHKGQCDLDLAAGTADRHYRDYCPNAPTIEELESNAK